MGRNASEFRLKVRAFSEICCESILLARVGFESGGEFGASAFFELVYSSGW